MSTLYSRDMSFLLSYRTPEVPKEDGALFQMSAAQLRPRFNVEQTFPDVVKISSDSVNIWKNLWMMAT